MTQGLTEVGELRSLEQSFHGLELISSIAGFVATQKWSALCYRERIGSHFTPRAKTLNSGRDSAFA
jgi:hypothetical protein